MNNPPAPHDSLGAIIRMFEEFGSKNRPIYPQWRIELQPYDSGEGGCLWFWCERPCCDGECVVLDGKSLRAVVDDESQHSLRLGFCGLFPRNSDAAFSWSFGGMTEFKPRAIENGVESVVPAGATVDDAIAALRELLDLVPVCIQVLEADDRHYVERDEFRMDHGRLPTPNPIVQRLANADPSAHTTSSLMGMLNLGWGPGPRATLSLEQSYTRVRCPGCGYLRFHESRVWDGAKAVVGNPRKDVDELCDALGGVGFRSMDCAWSQRVVDAVEEAGLTGARFHRIRHIVSRKTGREFLDFQPYYAVEFTGRVTIDRKLYDGGDGFLCPECGVWKPRLEGTVRWEKKCMAVVDEGTDLPDFALAANISSFYPFISARAARLFGRLGFTGFAYRSLVGFYPDEFQNNVGDPLAPGWWEEYTKTVRSILPAGFTR